MSPTAARCRKIIPKEARVGYSVALATTNVCWHAGANFKLDQYGYTVLQATECQNLFTAANEGKGLGLFDLEGVDADEGVVLKMTCSGEQGIRACVTRMAAMQCKENKTKAREAHRTSAQVGANWFIGC